MTFLRHLLRRSHPALAFTLVELLVTLSIIALLIALLLPSLGLAKASARRAVCLSLERQIAIGFAAYLNDNKFTYPYANPSWPDTYPYSYSASGPQRPWMMMLSPYLGGYKSATFVALFRCPENPWLPFSLNYQNQPATTYGMGPAFPDNWGDTSGTSPFADPTHARATVRESKLREPSGTLLLGELVNGANLPFSSGSSWTGGVSVIHTLFQSPYQGSVFWVTEDIGVISSASNCVRVNHGLAWNSLLADGHARLDTKKQLQTWAQVLYVGGSEPVANRYWANK